MVVHSSARQSLVYPGRYRVKRRDWSGQWDLQVLVGSFGVVILRLARNAGSGNRLPYLAVPCDDSRKRPSLPLEDYYCDRRRRVYLVVVMTDGTALSPSRLEPTTVAGMGGNCRALWQVQ